MKMPKKIILKHLGFLMLLEILSAFFHYGNNRGTNGQKANMNTRYNAPIKIRLILIVLPTVTSPVPNVIGVTTEAAGIKNATEDNNPTIITIPAILKSVPASNVNPKL